METHQEAESGTSDSGSSGSVSSSWSCVSENVAIGLATRSADDQISRLALAWILLVHRGTADGHNGFFIYGSSGAIEDSGHVRDIVGSGTEQVSDLLTVIQQRQRKNNSNTSSLYPIFFSNFDPEESRPEVRMLRPCVIYLRNL